MYAVFVWLERWNSKRLVLYNEHKAVTIKIEITRFRLFWTEVSGKVRNKEQSQAWVQTVCWGQRCLPTEAASQEEFRTGDEVHIWSATVPSHFSCAGVLSDEENRAAASFVFPRDQLRYRFSHSILRLLLSAYACCEPASLAFGKNRFGKPFLRSENGRSPLQFSMSHSRETVCVAIAMDRAIGLDIEYVDPVFAWPEVAEAVFSCDEQRHLAALPEHERLSAFFRLWTQKEAWLKAEGTGLGGLGQTGRNAITAEGYQLHSFFDENGYAGTVAVGTPVSAFRFFQYSWV